VSGWTNLPSPTGRPHFFIINYSFVLFLGVPRDEWVTPRPPVPPCPSPSGILVGRLMSGGGGWGASERSLPPIQENIENDIDLDDDDEEMLGRSFNIYILLYILYAEVGFLGSSRQEGGIMRRAFSGIFA